MKQTKKNEELQSRREFFKNAAKSTLPILAVAAFGPALLSCEKDDDDDDDGGCKGSCKGSCKTSCSGSCSGACVSECYGSW